MTDRYDEGFAAGQARARELMWHFLTGQASAESSLGKAYFRGEPKFRQTLYIRDHLYRFLGGNDDT